MFKVMCCKNGQYYIPKNDPSNPEFLVYSRTMEILDKAKNFDSNGARVVIEFEKANENGHQKVTYQMFNFTREFYHEFDKRCIEYRI